MKIFVVYGSIEGCFSFFVDKRFIKSIIVVVRKSDTRHRTSPSSSSSKIKKRRSSWGVRVFFFLLGSWIFCYFFLVWSIFFGGVLGFFTYTYINQITVWGSWVWRMSWSGCRDQEAWMFLVSQKISQTQPSSKRYTKWQNKQPEACWAVSVVVFMTARPMDLGGIKNRRPPSHIIETSIPGFGHHTRLCILASLS